MYGANARKIFILKLKSLLFDYVEVLAAARQCKDVGEPLSRQGMTAAM